MSYRNEHRNARQMGLSGYAFEHHLLLDNVRPHKQTPQHKKQLWQLLFLTCFSLLKERRDIFFHPIEAILFSSSLR